MTLQDSWAKNFPWVELFKSLDGNSFMMCCKIYTIIEHRNDLFISKLDGLGKHNDRKLCQVVRLTWWLGNHLLTKITNMCTTKIFVTLLTMITFGLRLSTTIN
jgi:hypothetical protein